MSETDQVGHVLEPSAGAAPPSHEMDDSAAALAAEFGLPSLSLPPEVKQYLLRPVPKRTSDPEVADDLAQIKGQFAKVDEPIADVSAEEVTGKVLGGSAKDRAAALRIIALEEYVDDIREDAPTIIDRNTRNAEAVRTAWQAAAAVPAAVTAYIAWLEPEVAELATRLGTLQALESGPQPDHPTPQEDAQRPHRQKELATVAQWHAITSRVLEFLTTTGYLDLLDSAEAGALGDMWRAIARDADEARERLRRLRVRRKRWHKLRYLLYLAVAAILGVVIGAVLALTPVAGFISFAAAALVQAALDRWMITPAIDRRTARQELADLRALAVKCKDFLLKARAAQATMYPVASAYGAKIEPVLQPPGGRKLVS
jgi:hypothetical protein